MYVTNEQSPAYFPGLLVRSAMHPSLLKQAIHKASGDSKWNVDDRNRLVLGLAGTLGLSRLLSRCFLASGNAIR